MKKLLIIILSIGLYFQAQADINLPPSLFGYWESDDVGIFIFSGGMRFVEKGGDPISVLGLDKEVIVVEGVEDINDIVYISFSQAEIIKTPKIQVKVLDDFHFSLKFQESAWLNFEKKETNIASSSFLFDYAHTLDPKLYTPSLNQKEKYERLASIPEILRGFWMADMFHSLIFEDRIVSGHGLTWIDDVYKNENLFILKGRRDISDEPVIYVFKVHKNKVLTQSYTNYYLLKWAHKNDLKLLTELSHEHEGKFGSININDIFFERYYMPGVSKLATDFTTSFQVNRDATVNILGEEYKLFRISAMVWGEGVVDNGTLGFMLELEGIKSKEMLNVQANLSSRGVEFIVFFDESVKVFKSFNSLLEHLIFQILTLLASVAVAIFILYRLIILPRKLKQRLTSVQLEGIKSQLNPHFLFNSMASIQSLLNQEKPKEANRYLSDLSDLLRYHLDAGSEDMVLLSEELSALQHYLELENLRSPFAFSFEIDSGINPDTTEIPNQLLQPLVENAVKHGLRYTDAPKLLIRVQKKAKSMCIYILDNGPGIFAAEKLNEKLPTLRKTHKGLALIREKISILKKKGLKCNLSIQDRQQDLQEEESGTQVCVEFPLGY